MKSPVGKARAIREWAVVLVVAVGIALLLRSVVVQQYYVSGPSMEPTMEQNDRLLVGKFAYWFSEVNRGHVIVFNRPTYDGDVGKSDELVKRVIAVPGDRIEIRTCRVFVNEVPLEEDYAMLGDDAGSCGMADMDVYELESEEVFVMGDNRPQSFDSRMFGAIRRDWIVGRAYAIVWPLGSARGL